MLAAMLAALMSSLTSQYNSCSSVFVIDIWKVARKNASEKEVVVVGRLAGLTLIVLSVLYLPILSVSGIRKKCAFKSVLKFDAFMHKWANPKNSRMS